MISCLKLIKLISNFFKYLNIYQCVNNNVYCDLHYLIELLEELFFIYTLFILISFNCLKAGSAWQSRRQHCERSQHLSEPTAWSHRVAGWLSYYFKRKSFISASQSAGEDLLWCFRYTISSVTLCLGWRGDDQVLQYPTTPSNRGPPQLVACQQGVISCALQNGKEIFMHSSNQCVCREGLLHCRWYCDSTAKHTYFWTCGPTAVPTQKLSIIVLYKINYGRPA